MWESKKHRLGVIQGRLLKPYPWSASWFASRVRKRPLWLKCMAIGRPIEEEEEDQSCNGLQQLSVNCGSRANLGRALIRPICLPESDTFGSSSLVGESCDITGWGRTAYGNRNAVVTHLQEARVDITDKNNCSNAYERFRNVIIDDGVVCAISPTGQDTCQGDSGGPLMLTSLVGGSFNFYLLGVVSRGYKCAEPGYPAIYSKVVFYVDWIKKNMT
ncbi:serine-type endopeptidase activity protein [Homalodisca vitripennis]|nr:serine-type endopeptidase activity protein [Homalodisca vitripennis]